MTVNVPLAQMSVREKMDLMEAILDDLSRHETEVPLPEWHSHVLEERHAMAERGEVQFTDWETAKAEIRQRCHSK
jgi:hypothetical protein